MHAEGKASKSRLQGCLLVRIGSVRYKESNRVVI